MYEIRRNNHDYGPGDLPWRIIKEEDLTGGYLAYSKADAKFLCAVLNDMIRAAQKGTENAA